MWMTKLYIYLLLRTLFYTTKTRNRIGKKSFSQRKGWPGKWPLRTWRMPLIDIMKMVFEYLVNHLLGHLEKRNLISNITPSKGFIYFCYCGWLKFHGVPIWYLNMKCFTIILLFVWFSCRSLVHDCLSYFWQRNAKFWNQYWIHGNKISLGIHFVICICYCDIKFCRCIMIFSVLITIMVIVCFLIADILWVITVPAIWTDASKQFTKEAAIQVSMHIIIIVV